MQLKKLFGHFNSDSINDDKKLQSQYVHPQSQNKQLKIRFGLNQIDKETYELTIEHLTSQLLEIDKEMHNGNQRISNLEELISVSLKKLIKLSTVWTSSDLDSKTLAKIIISRWHFL